MQFSTKSKEHVDACRFCWMCRHICPIGNATGQERNTARARALGLSLAARDAVEYSEDIINNVYECALCGACVKECVTGWDPVMFTKEARLAAALEGKLPDYIMTMLSNLQDKGNIYGADLDDKLTFETKNSDTLLFLGEDARFKAPECAAKAIELLKKAGADFTVLENEPSSGYSMDFMLGAAAETKAVMENCAKALSPYKRVICYDPADAKVMKREYKEWGIDLKPEVLTFTEYVSGLIKDKALNVKNSGLCFTPQDSFLLARDLEETEPVREILSACGTVNEMLLNRKDTMLAGNLIMNEYMPQVIERVAADRWINAKNMNTKILVTQSPAEYVMLKKTKPENIELMTVEEAVLKCL
ncbi:MAG: (Fe-S)-binding protein [Clostridiales bacterium]|nr:(Fe-S)-binding protein [Clostridiales bacterium]